MPQRKPKKKLGIQSSEILSGNDGEPIWPDDVVGSISHCKELVGAIVNNDPEIKSLGLDIERTGKIKLSMWNKYLTAKEIEFLKEVNSSETDYYSTLLFSLKESFYKAQFPITGKKLRFTDVEVSNPTNSFQVEVVKNGYDLDSKSSKMYGNISSPLI